MDDDNDFKRDDSPSFGSGNVPSAPRLLNAVADILVIPAADIDSHSHLQEDLGLNPVEMADLVNNLSSRFDIIFEPGDLHGVETIGDLIELIEDKQLES